MVRETRYLWVGNLPEKVAEERISVQFARHGKIQSVKLLPQSDSDKLHCAVVAFMDIKSAAKAHNSENKLDGVQLQTQYSEPTATGCSVTVSTKPDVSKQQLAAPTHVIPEIPLRPQNASASSMSSQPRGSVGRYTTRPKAADSGAKVLEKKREVVTKKATAVSAESCSANGKLGLLIRRLPSRSTDSSIRDGLFHEYKKHGKVTSVSVIGQGDDRHAVVSFKKPEDASKAYENSVGKTFFGSQIIVEPHEGFEVDDMEFQPPEAELDEYHHKATRTLFVGNLEKEVDKDKLRQIFHRFGYIIDIDIKNQGNVACYAFVQYDDIKSVVQALHTMDGEFIGNNKIKLGFGKSMPTNCVWIDGVDDSVSVKFLSRQFTRYGPVNSCVIDKEMCRALIFYDSAELAQRAVNEMRGRAIAGKKIQIDFASRDCQVLFYDNMERTSQLRPGERPLEFHGPFTDSRATTSSSFERTAPPAAAPAAAAPTPFAGPAYDRATWGRGGPRGFRGGRGGNWSSRGDSKYFDGYTVPGSQDEYSRERRSRFPGQGTPGSGYGSVEDGPSTYEDYGQELREYGYTQRDRPTPDSSPAPREHRRESRADSPFSRSSRFASPTHDLYGRSEERTFSDRYRDTDSQSGERESVRSFRSGEPRRDSRQYDEQYVQDRYVSDDKGDRERRAGSPTSSEYSTRSKSPSRFRSRSASPAVSVKSKKHKDKSHRHNSRSPDEYYRDSRTRSPSDFSHKSKDTRSRKSEYKEKQDRYESDGDRRPRLGSKVSRVPSNESLDKHSKRRRSRDAEALESERSLSESRPRKRTLEEYFRQKSSDSDAARQRRLERQVSRSLSAGSKDRNKPDKAALESVSHTLGLKPPVHAHTTNVKGEHGEEVGSGSTTSGSKTPMDSDQESFGEQLSSHSSGEVTQLEKEKLHLLSMLQQLDDTGSTSEAEDDRANKKPRMEDVFDLERDPTLSMKKWRETARLLENAGDEISASQTKAQAAEAIQEKLKALDASKFKPIDSSQSFRKQMEALRKNRLECEASRQRKERQNAVKMVYAGTEEEACDSLAMSPREIPSEFIPNKRRKMTTDSSVMDSMSKRSYRTKHMEESIGVSSEGEEGECEPAMVPAPVPPPSTIPDLTLSLKDEILARKQLMSKSEHSNKEARGESSKGERSSRARRDSRDSCSLRSSSLELRTDNPRIIPDSPVDVRGPDGKLDSRRIPQEPRSIPDGSKREFNMSLPLPKFAKNAFQSSKPQDKPMVSPKTPAAVQAASPQVSPAITMMSSPPFSPAIHSPQMSPVASRVEEQPPPPPPPPPPQTTPSRDNCLSAIDVNVSDSDHAPSRISDVAEAVGVCSESSVEGPGSSSHTMDGDICDTPPSPLSPPPPPPPPPPPKQSCTEKKAVLSDSNSQTPDPIDVVHENHRSLSTSADSAAFLDKTCATSPVGAKTPECADSDSDSSDLISPSSPGRPSLDERIRALDEKLSMTQSMPKPMSSIVSGSSTEVNSASLSSNSAILDYSNKYKIRKRDSIPPMSLAGDKAEPSPIMKSILSRSTIFDQDQDRLKNSGNSDAGVLDATALKLPGILKKSPPSSRLGPLVTDGGNIAMIPRLTGAPDPVMYHTGAPQDLMSAAGYPMLNTASSVAPPAAIAMGYNYNYGNRSPAYSSALNCNPVINQGVECVSRTLSVESLPITPVASGRPCDPRRAAQEHMRMLSSRQVSPVISPGYPQPVVPGLPPDANKLTVYVAEPYPVMNPAAVPVNSTMSPPILKKQELPPTQDTVLMTVAPAKPSISDLAKTKEINSPPIPILKKEIKEPSPDRKPSHSSSKRKANEAFGDFLAKNESLKSEKKSDVKTMDVSSGVVKAETLKCDTSQVKKEKKHDSTSGSSSSSKGHKDNYKDASKKHGTHSKSNSAKINEKKTEKDPHSNDKKLPDVKKKDHKHHDKSSKSSRTHSSSKEKTDPTKTKKDGDSDSKKDKTSPNKINSKSDKDKSKTLDRCDKNSKHEKHDKRDRGDDKGRGLGSSSSKSSAGADSSASSKPKADSADKTLDKPKSAEKSKSAGNSCSSKSESSSKQSKEAKDKHESRQSSEKTEKSDKATAAKTANRSSLGKSEKSDKAVSDKSSSRRSKSTDGRHPTGDVNSDKKSGRSNSHSRATSSDKKSSPDKSRPRNRSDGKSGDKKSDKRKRRKSSSEKNSPTSEKLPGSAVQSRKKSDKSEENRELKMLGSPLEGGNIYMSMYDMVKSRSNKERVKEQSEKKSKQMRHKLDEAHSRRRRSKLSSSMEFEDSSDFESNSDDSSAARDVAKPHTAKVAETKSSTPKHPKKQILHSSSSDDEHDMDEGRKVPPPTKKKTLHMKRISDDSLSDTTDSDSDFSMTLSKPRKSPLPQPIKSSKSTPSHPTSQSQQPKKPKFIYTSSSSSSSDLSSDSDEESRGKGPPFQTLEQNSTPKSGGKTLDNPQSPKLSKLKTNSCNFISSDSSDGSDSDILPSVHEKSKSGRKNFIKSDEEPLPKPQKPKSDHKIHPRKIPCEESNKLPKAKPKIESFICDSDSEATSNSESALRRVKKEEREKKRKSLSDSKKSLLPESSKSVNKIPKKVKKDAIIEKGMNHEEVAPSVKPLNSPSRIPLETKAQLKAKPSILEDPKRPESQRQERASLFEVVEAHMESPKLDQSSMDKELFESKTDQIALCWNVDEGNTRTPVKQSLLEESDTSSIVSSSRSSPDSRPSCISRSDNIFEKMELKEDTVSPLEKRGDAVKVLDTSAEITPFDPVPDNISLTSPDPEPCPRVRKDSEKSVSAESEDLDIRPEEEHTTTNEEAESIVKLFERQCAEQMKEMENVVPEYEMSPAVHDEVVDLAEVEKSGETSQEEPREPANDEEEEEELDRESTEIEDKQEAVAALIEDEPETKSDDADSTCNELIIDESSSQEEDLPQLVVETVVETQEEADPDRGLGEDIVPTHGQFQPIVVEDYKEDGSHELTEQEERDDDTNVKLVEASTTDADDGEENEADDGEEGDEETPVVIGGQTEQSIQLATKGIEEELEKEPPVEPASSSAAPASAVIDSVPFSAIDMSVDGLSAEDETEEARDELNAAIENLIEKHLEPTVEEQQEQVEIQTVEETIVPPEETLVEGAEEQVVDIVEDVQIEQAPSVEVCCEQSELPTAALEVVDIPTSPSLASPNQYDQATAAPRFLPEGHLRTPDLSLVPDMYKGAPTEPQREPVVLRGDQLEDHDGERNDFQPAEVTPSKSPRGRGRGGRGRGRGGRGKKNEDNSRASAKSPASENIPTTPNNDLGLGLVEQQPSAYPFDTSKVNTSDGSLADSSLELQYHNEEEFALDQEVKTKGGRKMRGKGRKGNSPRRESRSESEMSEEVRSTPRTPTRGSPRNLDPGTPPTPPTPPSVRRKLDVSEGPEKFSSRGRKIIPKERDGEVSPVTRKSRKSSAPREGESPYTFDPKKPGQKIMSESAPSMMSSEMDIEIKRRGRHTSPKPGDVSGFENLVSEENMLDDKEMEERGEDNKRQTRRRSQRIGQKEDTESVQGAGEQNTDSLAEDGENHSGVVSQERVKRVRKTRHKKGNEVDTASPRRHEYESNSPRTTSPKASPVVKLEKLPLEFMRRDDLDDAESDTNMPVKDLYEWEDDDEKPIPEYTHKRRKRKAPEDKEEAAETIDIPEPPSPPSHSPAAPLPEGKKLKVAQETVLPNDALTMEADREHMASVRADIVTLPPKKDPQRLAEIQSVPTAPSEPLQLSSEPRHLPLKLEMKKQAADAAAAAAAAAAKAKLLADVKAATPCKQAAGKQWQQGKQPGQQLPSPAGTPVALESKTSSAMKPCWENNMDKIICDVAKGIFDRGTEYNYYTKMREKGKDDPLSSSPLDKLARSHLDDFEHPKATSVVTPINLQEPLVVNTAVVGPHTMASPRSAPMHSPGIPKVNRLQAPEMKSPPAPVTPVSSPKIQSPPAQASPAPSLQQPFTMVHTAISASAPEPGNPMLAIQKACYPVSEASFVSSKHQVALASDAKGKAVTVMPRPVHIGVVSSHAYNRESSPLGQMIEKVPNPHLRLGPESEPRLATSTAPSNTMMLQQQYRHADSVMASLPSTTHLIESAMSRQSARGLPCRATSPEVALVRPQPQQVAVAPQPPLKPDVCQRLPAVSQPPMQLSPQLPKSDHSPAIRQLSPAIRQSSPSVAVQISHPMPVGPFSMSPVATSVPINYTSASLPSPPITSTQASELRAVLAQPSRLAQQEQILQQQRLQQQQQTGGSGLRPPTPQQAPGVIGLGQHRMPFTIPEPRSSGGRAEPKLPAQSLHVHPQHAGHADRSELPSPQPAFTSSQSPVLPKPSQPDVRPGMPPPTEPRPPLPQQYYPSDLRMQPGMPFAALPLPRGIAIDPRMFPGTPQHAEFLAHQGLGPMLPGMVAPQPPPQALLAAQQGAATEHREANQLLTNRPPSRHRASPSVQQPPSRNSTPLTPGLPSTQMPPQPRHPVDMSTVPSDGMAMLLRRYPVLWQGLLNLKNDTSAVQMHFVAGSKQLVDLSLPQMGPDGIGAPLRIAQRMRLEQAQLEGVAKRMESDSEYSMLLAIPCGLDHMELIHQSNTLRTGFISYLQQKQAAGIVNVPAPGCTQPAYVVHIFPPCPFSSSNLSQVAPDLLHSVSDMAYLLIIIATVSPN